MMLKLQLEWTRRWRFMAIAPPECYGAAMAEQVRHLAEGGRATAPFSASEFLQMVVLD